MAILAVLPVVPPSHLSPARPLTLSSRGPTPTFRLYPVGNTSLLANRTVGWSSLVAPPVGFGSGGGLFADSATGSAVAFGGVSSGTLVNSTFVYSESTDRWTSVAPGVAPSPRSDFAFGFDSALGVGALFGGVTSLASLADSNQTWEYNSAGAWHSVGGSLAPPAREDAAFAVDPTLGIGLLFGGWNRSFTRTSSVTYSDLWELNLTTWTWAQLTPVGATPPPLEGSSLAWDPSTNEFDLFGGCYPCSSSIWEFNPVTLTWTERPSGPGAPLGRSSASFGYDPALRQDLLFGGTSGVASFNDTYLYNATTNNWTAQTLLPHPSARFAAASGFLDVPGNQTWLVAGGLTASGETSDLWRLSSTSNLSIRVVNASAPSQPLGGVGVNLSDRRTGLTNASGYLNLTQVNGEGQPLNLTDNPWFFPLNTTLWFPPGGSSAVRFTLTPEPLGSVFAGVTTVNASPLSGAFANLSVDGVRINPSAHVTNASGNVTFAGVPPGRANVSVSLPEWRSGYANGILRPGGQVNVSVELVPEPVLTVNILGRLPTGSTVPLDNAVVYLNGVEVGVTDSAGVLVVVSGDVGLTSVYALVYGFEPQFGYVSVPWTGNASTTLVLLSVPYGTLLVGVEDGKDGQGISGATVTVGTRVPLAWGSFGETNSTNPVGYTQFSLPEGLYNVYAAATGFLTNPVAAGATAVAGETREVTVVLQPIPPGNLSFHVRDSTTHRPIAGANVTAAGELSGVTNSSGYFNASALPGTFSFLITARGYIPNSTYVVLTSYETLNLSVNLTPLPRVVLSNGGWTFALFPGGLLQLWPYLALPAFLLVGGFLYASVRRAQPSGEAATRRPPAAPPPTGRNQSGSAKGPALRR